MKKTFWCLIVFLVFSCKEVEVTDVYNEEPITAEYPCVSDALNCLDSINIEGGSVNLYSSFSLDSVNLVSGAIIVVHGATRNGDDYFNRMISTIKSVGLEDSIMVIAPQFITEYEKVHSKDWYWNTTSWKWGNQSYMNGSQISISSFEVIDYLLSRVANTNKFPNLSKVLITGHSSGSAFTHTFASTKSNNTFRNLKIDFAVINNQYFLYPDSNRFLNGALFTPNDCSNYNDWPLGLTDPNPYIENLGVEVASINLIGNRIDYFIGSNDTQINDMSSGCAYQILGEHRFQKTINFNDYLDISFENNLHQYTVVQGIGHSSTGMFFSNEFKSYINELF